MTASPEELFERVRNGDAEARDQLFPLIHRELHGLARRKMAGQPPAHTLQTTALVNEAYIRLFRNGSPPCEDKNSFLRLASTAMRTILVDHARRRKVRKSSARTELELDQLVARFEERATDLVALDEAMARLEQRDAAMAALVELRFFGGRTMEECAEVLRISERTAYRDWDIAKSWLRREVGELDG